MPAFSFKERFVPFVEDGSKPGTVRNFRKHRYRKGDTAYLYYGLRTKQCRKLKDPERKIHHVYTIVVTDDGDMVILTTPWLTEEERERYKQGDWFVNDFALQVLTERQKDQFAWCDGFRNEDSPYDFTGCFQMMFRWWKQTHALPFVGAHIVWDRDFSWTKAPYLL